MKFKYKMRLAWLVLAVLISLIVVWFCSGCEVLKTRKQNNSDSTHVARITTGTIDSTNAGSVKKTDEKSKDAYEWWRMIVPGRDTTINNFYTQPIIYEGGKGVKEETKNTTDSSWFIAFQKQMQVSFDSMNNKILRLETSNHTETKGLGLWLMVALMAGTYVVLNIIGYSLKNFTIIKKSKS